MKQHLFHDEEFHLAIAKNARLQSKVLAIFFGAILLIATAEIFILPQIFDAVKEKYSGLGANVFVLPIMLLFVFLMELFGYIHISKQIKKGKYFSQTVIYFSAIVEALFPTVFIIILMNYFAGGGFTAIDLFNAPPFFFYILFIILSPLALDFRLSVTIGLVSAMGYGGLLLYYIGNPEGSVNLMLLYARMLVLAGGGIVAGVVALKIKEAVISSLQSKNELIHTLDEKVKDKTKEIEKQNELLADKNKNITDSINCAKRIQTAILPPDKIVEQYLPECFVLYLPKDIVSGDFYFVDKIDDKVIFAAVDCTGHGVPGALMSVVGFNYLSQAVTEKKISKPSEILQFLDAGVNHTLRQSAGSGVSDGMDLALCTLDTISLELQFAGAFNPLWLVRKTGVGFEEIGADKFPIGTNAGSNAGEYVNHKLQLSKGDTIYLFSDGYADQFGGPQGKKFKYRQFKDTIISVQEKTMDEQKKHLKDKFRQWHGELEQVDDVCIIGVKV